MRAHGLVPTVPEGTAGDHLCWVHDDDAAFEAAVRQFLAGGLARGERLLCVGERVIESVRAGAGGPDALEPQLAGGGLEMFTVAEAYAATGWFAPERQLAFYESATRRAIADGYQGLRVVAEVSPLAEEAGSRADLVRWEHLADRFMAAGSGMSAMCAYRADLPAAALTDVASAHPLVHVDAGDLPGFRLFLDDGRLVLAGSVDTFDAHRLAALLASSPVEAPVVAVDLTFLEFLDGAGCRVLTRWAEDLRACSVAVEVHHAPRLVRRLWRVLGYTEAAPVTFA